MLILTNISPTDQFQNLEHPGRICDFLSPPFEPLRMMARSRGPQLFQIKLTYQYCTHGQATGATWTPVRTAGHFKEKDHFRWNAGKRTLLGRAGRRVPTRFMLTVPDSHAVRWLRVGPLGLVCDVSLKTAATAATKETPCLRLWLATWAPGPKETANSYKAERPFVDLEREPEVLRPSKNWHFTQNRQ